MSRFRGSRGLTLGTILIVLFGTVGCAPPGGLQSGDRTPQADQNPVPFHEGDGKPSHPGDLSAAREEDSRPETNLPFHVPQNLPAGTLLTVRLKNPISAENPNANGTFEAVVDQPVVIEGNKLVPLGATVSGRVESARASNLKRNRGYVRLTLESIQLSGSNVPVQTSSLFVRGNAGPIQASQDRTLQSDASAAVIHLEKGHRLVFRLTEPVYVEASQRVPPSH